MATAADGGEDGDRNVDEQAPAPRDVLGEHASEEDADRSSGARDGTVGAERLRPLLGVVLEGDGQDGQGGGCHQCGEPALQGAGGEEHRLVDGQATERRCAGEAQQPDDEHPLATRVVGDPATQQQEAAESQGVRGDDPLAVGRGDMEGMLRRWQRDRDDRRIENDHQLRHDDHGENAPAPRVGTVDVQQLRGRSRHHLVRLHGVTLFRSPETHGRLRGHRQASGARVAPVRPHDSERLCHPSSSGFPPSAEGPARRSVKRPRTARGGHASSCGGIRPLR